MFRPKQRQVCRLTAGISHLEDVDMDVRHGEHGSADKHAEQGSVGRQEAGHVDQQPVLRIQAQCYHQDGLHDVNRRVSFEVSCKTIKAKNITCLRIN